MNIYALLPSFKQFCLREKGLQPKSYRTIVSHMKAVCAYTNHTNIRQLKTSAIKEYLYDQAHRYDWSPRTFRNHLQSISTFCDWAVDQKYLPHNPVRTIKKPKLPQALPRYLTEQEVQSVIYAAQQTAWTTPFISLRNYALIMTFLQTGIRLNELRHLTITDLNLSERTLHIEKGKGNKMRLVPIHPKLFPILKGYVTLRTEHYPNALWLFPSIRMNAQLSCKYIQQVCRHLSITSGVKFTPHMLRHTFGRQCTNQNLPFYKLKEIMGHSSVTTTERYASVSMQGIYESFAQLHF